LLIPCFVCAQKDHVIARLEEVNGDVFVLSSGIFTAPSAGQGLLEGDIVRTADNGSALIKHNTGFISNLGPATTLRISSQILDISGLTLGRGTLQVEGEPVGGEKEFRVSTPVAVTSARGTAYLVVGAGDGQSLVSVSQGTVSAGMGQDVMLVSANNKTEGRLATGYAAATSGQVSIDLALAWRREKERDLSSRSQQVLAELGRLQKKEDEDWRKIEEEILSVTQRTAQGKATGSDRLFFRRVFDISDRMSARMLLAVDLREQAGVTPKPEADKERIRLQNVWNSQDWRRKAWEGVGQGKAAGVVPENLKQMFAASQESSEENQEIPAGVEAKPDTAALFPKEVQGVYLGMTVQELEKVRPNAKAPTEFLAQGDLPAVYTEKQISGGDWSKEGWFTGMYTFYRGKMVQGALLAFTGTEKLRKELLERFTKLYGKPWRYRVEPDWAQQGQLKGSTVEWKSAGIEVILVSRFVPTLQGNTRGLELRIRLAGYGSILESQGQFTKPAAGQLEGQLKTDFPELEGVLSRNAR
jgi:hypothetical protein